MMVPDLLSSPLRKMKSFIESMSLGEGAMLIAFLSAVVEGLFCLFFPPVFRWLMAIAIPVLLSYCLYWLPVWMGADPSEYGNWQLITIGAWFLAGAASASLVAFAFQKWRG
jgi:hypothetical protein